MVNMVQQPFFPYRLSSQLIVFIKSTISPPFLKSLNCNNSIYKILTTPSYGVKERHCASKLVQNKGGDRLGVRKSADGCRATFSPVPIPTKPIKSLVFFQYKSSLGRTYCTVLYNFGLSKKIEFLSVHRIKDPQRGVKPKRQNRLQDLSWLGTKDPFRLNSRIRTKFRLAEMMFRNVDASCADNC